MMEQAVQETCLNLQLKVDVTTSVGMAFYPEDGESVDDLLGAADHRMYLQKRDAKTPAALHGRATL
jgi:GGDEF domain-containing protein